MFLDLSMNIEKLKVLQTELLLLLKESLNKFLTNFKLDDNGR